MSNFSELDSLILRETTNPPLTNNNALLSSADYDTNAIKIYNAIQDIADGANVTAYDAVVTYDMYSTDAAEKYVSYNSRIWSAVYNGSPSTFSGQTPAEGSYWTQISLAQMLGNPIALTKIAEAYNNAYLPAAIYSTELNIPTASVLTLNGTPLEIVSAPGAGYAIQVISASYKSTFNSVAYATNTTIQLQSTGATAVQFSTFINYTVSTHRHFAAAAISGAGAASTQIIENVPLMVNVATGNPTAGNSDIKIYVLYRIITL